MSNVIWVWCPLADDVTGPFEAYHPGADCVGVLALDGYNWGAEHPENGGWRTPRQLFDGPYRRLEALGPQPVWLAEVGCAPGTDRRTKPAWLRQLVGLGRRYNQLEAVVAFSLDKERDWRVHHDPALIAAIRTARRRLG